MLYQIGYRWPHANKIETVDQPTARTAYAFAFGISRSDASVEFIRTSGGGQIFIEELKKLADKEDGTSYIPTPALLPY